MDRLAMEEALLRQLPQMPDLQCAWLLLCYCAAPRANHALRTIPNTKGRMPRRMMRLCGAPCKHAWASLLRMLPALRETSPSFPRAWAGWTSPKRFALPLRLTGQLGLTRPLSSPHAALSLPQGHCEPCPVNLNTPLLVCGRWPAAGHCSWPRAGTSTPPGTSSRAGSCFCYASCWSRVTGSSGMLAAICMRRQLKFVVYDNACAFARFVRGLARRRSHATEHCSVSSSLCFVLDRWHEQSRTACLDARNAL